MTGFELILPFLRPIESLILDPSVSEVMVNGSDRVFMDAVVLGVRGTEGYCGDHS
jgi:Flp pilus assembly CpaF family ATPase